MTGFLKGRGAHARTADSFIEHEQVRQDSMGVGSGLLIAVGSSLVLWAVLAQAARYAASFFS